MTEQGSKSADLVRRSQAGDDRAMDDLVARHLPWIQGFVRRRLGPALRRKGDTMDFVQDALIRALRYGPRFVTQDEGQFKALLGKIVENRLRDEHEYLSAKMRDYQREVRQQTNAVLDLDDQRRARVDTPSADMAKGEEAERLELALELLDQKDRIALRLRQSYDLSFAKIGRVLGVGEDGARKRHDRALVRMRKIYSDLCGGKLDKVIAHSLGQAMRTKVVRALQRAEDEALGHIANEGAGTHTIDANAHISAAVERAAQAFKSVPYHSDEPAYLEEVERSLSASRAKEETRGEDACLAPFDLALSAIREMRRAR